MSICSLYLNNPSFPDYIRSLYEKSKGGKSILLPAWDYDIKDADEDFLEVSLSWDSIDCEDFVAKFMHHVSVMENIAKRIESFKELNTKPKELLNEEEYKYWETFLKSLESSNNELFENLGQRKVNGENLSPEENEAYDKLLSSIKDDAKRRLGDNKYSYDIILRTMRSIEAIKVKAPIEVIALELKQLLEAMLLFSYGICEKAYALNELPTATLEELMDHYYYGDDIYSGDSEIALECALEAERKGSKKCFYKIGLIYQLGTQDRAPDYEMAATYYKKAIENQDYNGMDENERILACEYLMNLYWDPTLLDDVDKAIMYRKQYVDLIGGSYE